jgi:hypothetical protein
MYSALLKANIFTSAQTFYVDANGVHHGTAGAGRTEVKYRAGDLDPRNSAFDPIDGEFPVVTQAMVVRQLDRVLRENNFVTLRPFGHAGQTLYVTRNPNNTGNLVGNVESDDARNNTLLTENTFLKAFTRVLNAFTSQSHWIIGTPANRVDGKYGMFTYDEATQTFVAPVHRAGAQNDILDLVNTYFYTSSFPKLDEEGKSTLGADTNKPFTLDILFRFDTEGWIADIFGFEDNADALAFANQGLFLVAGAPLNGGFRGFVEIKGGADTAAAAQRVAKIDGWLTTQALNAGYDAARALVMGELEDLTGALELNYMVLAGECVNEDCEVVDCAIVACRETWPNGDIIIDALKDLRDLFFSIKVGG